MGLGVQNRVGGTKWGHRIRKGIGGGHEMELGAQNGAGGSRETQGLKNGTGRLKMGCERHKTGWGMWGSHCKPRVIIPHLCVPPQSPPYLGGLCPLVHGDVLTQGHSNGPHHLVFL